MYWVGYNNIDIDSSLHYTLDWLPMKYTFEYPSPTSSPARKLLRKFKSRRSPHHSQSQLSTEDSSTNSGCEMDTPPSCQAGR